MDKKINHSLEKFDFYILAFSCLWIFLIFADYLNKHPVYVDSFRHFSFHKLIIFFVAFTALILFIYSKRHLLGRFKKYLYSTLILISVPTVIMAISLSFAKYHTQEVQSHHHIYLLANSIYILLSGMAILFSSMVLGRKVCASFIDKKLILKSHFTLHLTLGIIITTGLLFLLGVFQFLNQWSVLVVVLLPVIICYKEAFASLKSIFSFEPDFSLLQMGLVMVMLFFCMINFVSILGPFPLGFDSRNLYMNIPMIVAHNGGLVGGFQPHNWELFSSIGLFLFQKIEVTMLMYQAGAVLVAMASYYSAQSIFKLSKTSALLVGALLIFTPAITTQMYTELKIDLGLLFFQLVTLQFYISHEVYKGKTKYAPYVFSIILGIMLGFGMGIKLLHFFLIIGLFVAMSFDRKNPYSVWAVSLIMIGAILFLRLDDQTGLRRYHQWADMLSYLFLGLGVVLTVLSFVKHLDFSKRLITKYLIIFACTVMTFSPWVILSAQSNKGARIMSIIRGGSGGHNMDQQKITDIYKRLNQEAE